MGDWYVWGGIGGPPSAVHSVPIGAVAISEFVDGSEHDAHGGRGEKPPSAAYQLHCGLSAPHEPDPGSSKPSTPPGTW